MPDGKQQHDGTMTPKKPTSYSERIGLYCHVNRGGNVREVVRANDPALISAVEALLLEAEIPYQIADQNMSILEGGIGAFPRRVLVDDSREEEARRLLVDAGIPPKGMRL
ncbi:DUF2007 domain-containing protein [Microtetraspora glauca]|uniref:DUF2007 domain-containing protein n=1 Tax=Microtetraspora glauca TaxID=1996 RepID=A0ABV3GRT1_MICGL